MKIISIKEELENNFIITYIPQKEYEKLKLFLIKKGFKNILTVFQPENIRISNKEISTYSRDADIYNQEKFSHIKKYNYSDFYKIYMT